MPHQQPRMVSHASRPPSGYDSVSESTSVKCQLKHTSNESDVKYQNGRGRRTYCLHGDMCVSRLDVEKQSTYLAGRQGDSSARVDWIFHRSKAAAALM
jgi:hypothetical protein